MTDNTVLSLTRPADALTEVLREGAIKLLHVAIEAEVEVLLAKHADMLTLTGHRAVVRNGYLPARAIQTGIGMVGIKLPKVRDRSGSGIKFNSSLVPPYLKRTKTIEEFIPWLYLKGISTGDVSSTLSVLLGEEVRGLSPNVVSSLKQQWEAEYAAWNKRDLSHKRYVYVWADGVYSNVRMDDRLCLLVLVGSDEHGRKELLALCDGFRESEASWSEILQSLKNRGLKHPPHVAVGDGSLGFWKAVNKIWPDTTHQRCWVHKTANVLDKLPKTMQPKVKEALHNIFLASTRADVI